MGKGRGTKSPGGWGWKADPGSLELREATLRRTFSELELSEDTGRFGGRTPAPEKGPYRWCLFPTRCCNQG